MKLSCLEWVFLIFLLTFMFGPLVMLGVGVLYCILPKEKNSSE